MIRTGVISESSTSVPEDMTLAASMSDEASAVSLVSVAVAPLPDPEFEAVVELAEPFWLFSSDVNLADAEVTVASAEASAAHSGAASRVASVCPAVTVWPTETPTLWTVPDVPKSRLA